MKTIRLKPILVSIKLWILYPFTRTRIVPNVQIAYSYNLLAKLKSRINNKEFEKENKAVLDMVGNMLLSQISQNYKFKIPSKWQQHDSKQTTTEKTSKKTSHV